MRIFVGGVATETNTFAPWPTGLRGYEEGGIFRGGSAARVPGGAADLMIRIAGADGHEVVEGLIASAEPSGPTLQAVYEGLRDELLADLRAKGPFDMVLLFLHGAMVAYGYDDCEGDLLQHVRSIVGPDAAIGVELDPHCHLTSLMMAEADAIVLMKEYPHTDFAARARELYDICVGKAKGRLRPVMAAFDCRMVGFYPTTTEPMAGLVRRLREVERRPGVLSASIVHGFPWGDTPDTGTKSLVVADGDVELAADAAREIGLALYAQRQALLPRFFDIEAGLDAAARSPGRVVLADTADNAGGGAPGDNVTLLRALLTRGVREAAFGCVWDPMAASTCAEAGLGARFRLRLGGKSGPASGDPLDLEVEVRGLSPNHSQEALNGARSELGLSVWIAVEGIDVVVNSIRGQVIAPDAFTGLGIDLGPKRLVAVKSSWHFQALFAPIASRIIPLATPGAIQMDFVTLRYVKKRDLDFFPRVCDPLGTRSAPAF